MACRQRRNLHHKNPWMPIELSHEEQRCMRPPRFGRAIGTPTHTQFDTTAKRRPGSIDDQFDVMAAAASRQNLERLNAAGTCELQTSL